jgi:hypothetical protein
MRDPLVPALGRDARRAGTEDRIAFGRLRDRVDLRFQMSSADGLRRKFLDGLTHVRSPCVMR